MYLFDRLKYKNHFRYLKLKFTVRNNDALSYLNSNDDCVLKDFILKSRWFNASRIFFSTWIVIQDQSESDFANGRLCQIWSIAIIFPSILLVFCISMENTIDLITALIEIRSKKKETKFECFLKIPDDERLLLNSISQSELSYIWIKRAFLESPSDCRSFSNLKISIQMLMRGPVITVPILFTFHLFAA